MRNKTTRLGVLGATALVALGVIGPMAGVASAQQATTTTSGATTTTLPPQKTVHGTNTNTNNCQDALDPAIQPPGTSKIKVTMGTDAFPQPHEGDQITLSNTTVGISIPATLLQLGVDAGIIKGGDVIPSKLDLIISGSGTKEGTHHYTEQNNVTIHVGPPTPEFPNGVAQPLTANLNLPSTKWTPVDKSTDVHFAEKSMLITSTIDLSNSLGIILTATFSCTPAGSAEFMALGGLGAPAATTTTTTTTTTTVPVTVPVTVAPQATNTLPRTGSTTGWLLAVAVGCLSAGLFALRSTQRRRARSYS